MGTQAWWNSADKALQCHTCHEPGGPSSTPSTDGRAGASARREYDKRHAAYEENVRRNHPILGGLILRFGEEPAHVKAWKKGETGEQAIGELIDRLCTESGWWALHDRRIRGTRANIDHIVVNQAGVTVIDAKNYRGPVRQEKTGGWFGVPEHRTLYVGKRDCTPLVDGVRKQVDRVRVALADTFPDVPVTGVLAFYAADWPWIGKPLDIHGVLINGKGLTPILQRPGELDPSAVGPVATLLASHFPGA